MDDMMSNQHQNPPEESQLSHPLLLARAWDPNVWPDLFVHSVGLDENEGSTPVVPYAPCALLMFGMNFWVECHHYKERWSNQLTLENISELILSFAQNPRLWFYKLEKQTLSIYHFPILWTLMNSLHRNATIKVQHLFVASQETPSNDPLFQNFNEYSLYEETLAPYFDSIPMGQFRFFCVMHVQNEFKKNVSEEFIVVMDLLPSHGELSLQQCFFIPTQQSLWLTYHQKLDEEDPFNYSVHSSTKILSAKPDELYERWMKATFRLLKSRHFLTQQLDESIHAYSFFAQQNSSRDISIHFLLDKMILLEKTYLQTRLWLEERRYLSSRSLQVWSVRRWCRQRFNTLMRLFLERMYFSEPTLIEGQDFKLLTEYYERFANILQMNESPSHFS